MRLILILLVLIAAFVVIQSQRHGCSFGQEGWMGCVMGKSTEATPAAETPAPAAETPAPAPAEPAPAPAEPAPAPQ
jgi:hypothetical protein